MDDTSYMLADDVELELKIPNDQLIMQSTGHIYLQYMVIVCSV